jgi:hypothetical protein
MVARRARWLGFGVFLIALLGSADDALARRAKRPRRAVDGLTRWLGAQDVPLLAAGHGKVKEPEGDACVRWAPRGSEWRAVDMWGRVVGRATITKAGRTDRVLGACHYPEHRAQSGAEGVLLASAEGPWRPGPSAEWKPGAAERDRLQELLAASSRVLGLPVANAVDARFFAIWNDVAKEQHRFAVVGGFALLVARVGKDGRWTLAWSDTELARSRAFGPGEGAERYAPEAVLDLTGDGLPEVIYRWDSGDDSGLRVIEFHPDTESFKVLATSEYGSTA